MMFETSRRRSVSLCHSWQFKICFVWGGELVSTLTSSILQMGLIWHIALTTGSSSLLSLASLAGFLPIALFGVLAGAVVDRLPLKRVLIGADLFVAAVGAALAIASLAGSLPAWSILIALFLRAAGTSFYTPASQSLTPHLAPPEHLVRLSGVMQAIQSAGYILGAALAAVIYPVAGITAMIALDVLGALFASLAVLAAQIDAGGLDEADRSSSFSNKVRELFSEISDGYKLIRGYRGLFAILWCGFVFAFAFSPLAALFPIMTLGHFGGSTGDAALVEVLFSAGMLAGSGILAATGGFRNRSLTMVAAIAGFGVVAIASGLLGPSLFAAFLPASFLMGACSPLYAGTQTALMQEQIPPEYLGRVFGLYGTIMAWAMPMGLAAPSVFAHLLGAPLWSVGSGATMTLLALAMLLAPSVRNVGKKIPGRFNSPSIRKRGGSHRFARQPSSPCDDEVLRRHPTSRSLFADNYHFRICRLAQGQNAHAGNRAKAKNRRERFFIGMAALPENDNTQKVVQLMELIVKAKDIFLEYAGRDILDIEELEIYPYDRIGLVGDNGAGKTSLLKILSGNLTIADADVRRFGSIALIGQLDELDLDAAQDNGEMLSRLNVAEVAQETMSGGEETRAKIASALSQHASAIFADEPTSHLDQDGIRLLVGQLKAFDGALLIVSHDRHFLDQVVDKIWELKDGGISEFWGDYSDYLRQKEEERKAQATRYEEAMRERDRLEAAIEKQRKKARQVDAKRKGAKKSNEYAGRLGHQKTTGTKQKKMHQAAKNMEKRLEALEGIEAPDSIRAVRFRQSKALELHSKFPISADDFSLSFGNCVLYDHAKFEIPLGAKVAITGGNGTGKTSLLKAIVRRADGINISPKAEIGYFEQTGYKFDARQSVISFMQNGCEYSMTEIRGILASMGIGPRDLTKDVGVLSGGEVIKLLLAKMLLGRYNILLMDEPGNYLDIKSAEALEQMMSAYAGTIVFVSHDKRLVENVADIVYEIKDTKLVKIFQRE